MSLAPITRLALVGALVLTAACGGAADEPPSVAATTAAKAAVTTAATTAAKTAATTAASGATPAAAGKAASAAADACALLTVEEVGRVLGATGVRAEAQPEAFGASYCMYRDASGALIAATSYLKAGATVFNAVSGGSQPQSGIGDKAQWDANSATLQVLKGQSVHAITAGDGRMEIARRLDLAKQLGTIGVARQ